MTEADSQPYSSAFLYGSEHVSDTARRVILVRDDADVDALLAVGLVSVATGDTPDVDSLAYVVNRAPVVLWPDAGYDGLRWSTEIRQLAGEDLPVFDPECNPHDYLERVDPENIIAAIDSIIVPTPGRNVINGNNGLVRASDIQPEAVSWLWHPRIPLGKLTLLEGDPDQGKSLITLDLASRVSRGQRMPDGSPGLGAPAHVLLLTAEDGRADTIRPRLEAAGADLERVLLLDEIPGPDGELRPLELPRDTDHVERVVATHGIRLVVVDVLLAFLGSEVKALADQDIRRALRPLAKLAERTGAAVLPIRHLTKGGGSNALYRGGGAIGLTGAARSVLLAADDPEVPGRHVLARVKSNLAAPYPSLSYEMVVPLPDVPAIRWLGESHSTASELLAAAEAKARTVEADVPTAERALLEELLADGECPAADVELAAKARNLAYRDIWKAGQKLGVTRRRVGFGADGKWFWSLPPKPIVSIVSIAGDGRNNGGINANGVVHMHELDEEVQA